MACDIPQQRNRKDAAIIEPTAFSIRFLPHQQDRQIISI
jgi:hypothetical protein